LDRTITDRDIASAPGVHVDKELDGFIERRDVQRRKEEGERPAEAAWRASEKAQEAARREEMRLAWGVSTTRSRQGATGPPWAL
jgi:hypothetical protein